jgi:molybdenum cofactor biosynthesis enzyme MoaA
LAATDRGWIQPHALDELWLHTGTACNLDCPFCLEGSRPGDDRLQRLGFAEARRIIDEAVTLGVRQLSFTGGEPFVVKDIVAILEYAARFAPVLVLTNGTAPVVRRLWQIKRLVGTAYPVRFRVSIDHPEESRHDAGRGAGNFRLALQGLKALQDLGFQVSVARQLDPERDQTAIETAFRALFAAHGLPSDLRLVAFPDFGIPGAQREVPVITEDCMTRHQTEDSRRKFMCAFSKMVVKQGGRMRIYPCTLVDDDPAFDQGEHLADAVAARVPLVHHRCYSCFRYGSSCSEMG